ncbi:hypothetical protein [Actinophytocola sp.]|uniref:hypothetical protein n=1 Tax=Actinophytocola sp. TaxID=1872138 RepID=UPI002ED61C4A
MDIEAAFDDYQQVVDADPNLVKVARDRATTFKEAFEAEPDVEVAWLSGSLRRSTQLDPVHDVDMVIEYSVAEHPTWGNPGTSAAEAIEHARARAKDLLGNPGGSVDELVRRADAAGKNRAVKCFIDDPDDLEAFTVDVMPVLRQSDDTLLIPDAHRSGWIIADPEHLINLVQQRHNAWSYYRPMVRVLKNWRHGVPGDVKINSLVMEVLALECLPLDMSRPDALSRFFTAAATRVNQPIEDPAGHCGTIQPDLDVVVLRTTLEEDAAFAHAAQVAEHRGNTDEALRLWQKVFGTDFPAPAASGKTTVTGPALISAQAMYNRPQG